MPIFNSIRIGGTKRLRELDFLRGIAIILVLFRHKYLASFLVKMGWIGVDLFFVLSGFLVSGLLFREYQKFGSINVKLFLIRRGFKIYPLFYFTYIFYLVYKFNWEDINETYVISELLFFQNYVTGLGYAYVATWSLAIEEHFYFGLVFLFWGILYVKKNLKIEAILYALIILVIIGRFYFNWQGVDYFYLYTRTHTRIDSLLIGVVISYWYYFKTETLQRYFNKYRKYCVPMALVLLSFTPFYDYSDLVAVRTIGFSALYIAFGLLLVYFILNRNINLLLDKYFTATITNIVSLIGYSSYGIYIIHILIFKLSGRFSNMYFESHVFVLIQYLLAIFTGMLLTFAIENRFLRIRDTYFPKRTF